MHGDKLWGYVFLLAFVVIGSAETFLPLRSLPSSTPRRWTSNLVLFAVASAAVALAFRVTGVALAFTIRGTSHGLLNHVPLPYGVQFAVSFALLDLTAYVSHRLFHVFGLTWRVHQVHHAETDLDLTTGLRFHPLETLISKSLLLMAIALLGPPPAAVVFGELAVVFQDLLQHANLRFPPRADRALRVLVVTPAMHRVHHSQELSEQNANFGTVFSFWDRLCGTYRVRQGADLVEARCGLAELADGSELNAAQLLALPFRRSSSPPLSREQAGVDVSV